MKLYQIDAFDTGLLEIDIQHRKLLEKINEFFRVSSKNENEKEIIRLLHFLQTYVVEHFTDEELLYSKYEIGGLEEHKNIHNAIIRELDEIMVEIEKNGYSPIIELKVYNTLIRDLQDQIENYDRKLSDEIIGLNAFNHAMEALL